MRHWLVLMWVGQWRQVAEEEVHLCQAVQLDITFYFLLPPRCGGSGTAVSFFRWPVISLELWVQIGTADEGKC